MNLFLNKKVFIAIGIVLVIGIVAFFPHNKVIEPDAVSGKVISGAFDKTKLKTDAEWKKILTPDQYHILREQGTEVPFTGALDHETRKGTYTIV